MTERLGTIEDCDLVLSEIESINDSSGIFKKSVTRARDIINNVCRIPKSIHPITYGGVLIIYMDDKDNYREFTIIGEDIHTFYCSADNDILKQNYDNDIDIGRMNELIEDMEWDD